MVNSWRICLNRLFDIVAASGRQGLSFPDQCGLYSAACLLLRDLEDHVVRELEFDGYAREKIADAKWHIGAILGFDVSNQHGIDQHRTMAESALQSLESVLIRLLIDNG